MFRLPIALGGLNAVEQKRIFFCPKDDLALGDLMIRALFLHVVDCLEIIVDGVNRVLAGLG